MSERGPSDWLDDAAEIVERVTPRWVVAGALAAARYRTAQRGTTDADILMEWDPRVLSELEAAGYDVRVIAMPDDHPHLFIARRGSERVDFLFATVAYQQLAIDRGMRNHRLTAEDVIVHKLIAWRPRDRDDVDSILRAGHPLDTAYIEHWAAEWEVVDRWREATGPR